MRRLLATSSILVILFVLTGCVDGGPARIERPVTEQTAPKVEINVPPPQVVDQEKVVAGMEKMRNEISTEIQSSSNNTQNALSGLVNASVSKVAERVTGVEASMKDLLNITTSATANIDTKFESIVKANATLEARLTAMTDINAEMKMNLKASVQAMNEMKVDLGKISATAQAQIGFKNKLETLEQEIKNSAGRDVNYLPKEAVYLFVMIISILAGLASTITLVLGRNARIRAHIETDKERENVRYWQKVAMKAMANLEPTRAEQLSRELLPPPTGDKP